MTFLEIFEEMHRKDQGVTSGALAGVDGLTVEEWRAPGDDRDLSALCAEIVQFFRESARIASENGLGEAEEVLQVVEAAKGLKARAIAITGQPGSSLARAAHAVLCVPIRKEACPLGLAPTASTTAALALGDALAMVLMEERGFKSEDFRVFHPGGHLGRRLSARVRDFLRTGRLLPVVPVTATLAQAIKEMSAKESIGVTTIRARDGRLAGILTDGDLRRILRKSPDPKAALRRKAAEFMIRSPKTVDPDAAASEALRIMEVHGITSLVAVDARDRAVGLVHIHDLLGRGKTLI